MHLWTDRWMDGRTEHEWEYLAAELILFIVIEFKWMMCGTLRFIRSPNECIIGRKLCVSKWQIGMTIPFRQNTWTKIRISEKRPTINKHKYDTINGITSNLNVVNNVEKVSTSFVDSKIVWCAAVFVHFFCFFYFFFLTVSAFLFCLFEVKWRSDDFGGFCIFYLENKSQFNTNFVCSWFVEYSRTNLA